MFPFTADVAHAMGGGGAGANADPGQQMLGLLPLVAMFAIFYFLLIRPQQKRQKEHRGMLEALKKGDEVVTSAGMMGRVTAIQDDVVTVEVAPDVRIKFQKSSIASVKKAGA